MIKLKYLLVLLVLIIGQANGESNSEVIIFNTPRVTYALDTEYVNPPWGPWQDCPRHQYVVAFDVRTERDAGYDDTTINTICLYCAPFKGNRHSHDANRRICSSEGDYGKWLEKPLECQYLMIGFQAASGMFKTKTQPKYGILSVKFICSDQEDQEVTSERTSPYGKRQQCLSGQGICGIRTQVDNLPENKQRDNDQAGLMNVEMKCCDLPSPSHIEGFCNAKDSWEMVITCDHLRSNSSYCEYQQSIGTTMKSLSSQTTTEIKSHESMQSVTVGFMSESTGIYKADFSATIARTRGSETGYDWTMENSDSFNNMITTNVKFEVPAKTKATIFQVVGTCGTYKVRSSVIVRVDTRVDGEVHPPKALPGGFFCASHSRTDSSNAPEPSVGTSKTEATLKPSTGVTKKRSSRRKP